MKILSLALLAGLLATTAASATPVLKGDITVNKAIVTVGDIFDDAGILAETGMFMAPAPGTTGVVPLDDIRRAATLAGVADFENVGFTRIRVARAAKVVDASALEALLNADLARQGVISDGMHAIAHFDRAVGFNAEAVAVPASLLGLQYVPTTGGFTARFLIAGIDQPVRLSGYMELMTKAPRLLDNRAAGTILTPADFELVDVPLSIADAGGYADLDQLVGRQLARQSRAGMMLKPTDVTAPTVVKRNALVTVILKAGPMTLTVRGTSLGTAAAGEPVDVLNTATRKILHGVARSDGAVEIVTAVATAGL
jgi:flagella basal body P-ring formation protein FlgA